MIKADQRLFPPAKPVVRLPRFTDLVSPAQLAQFEVKVAMGIPMRSRG
jgi:hypothetical protein